MMKRYKLFLTLLFASVMVLVVFMMAISFYIVMELCVAGNMSVFAAVMTFLVEIVVSTYIEAMCVYNLLQIGYIPDGKDKMDSGTALCGDCDDALRDGVSACEDSKEIRPQVLDVVINKEDNT